MMGRSAGSAERKYLADPSNVVAVEAGKDREQMRPPVFLLKVHPKNNRMQAAKQALNWSELLKVFANIKRLRNVSTKDLALVSFREVKGKSQSCFHLK